MAEKSTDIAQRQRQDIGQGERLRYDNPFRMLERFVNDIDSMFGNFGLGRGFMRTPQTGTEMWMPRVDIHQENNELVIKADLPGMKKDDISVECTEDAIVLSGERRQEQENERGGRYRSEVVYGSFYRVIPLPEGAMTDQAKATFKDGVLELRMPAPPEQVSRGRKLEITEGMSEKSDTKK